MVLLAVLLLAQPTAVRATRMFDARRGVIVQPGLVVVEGERIVQAGGTAPAGSRTIELGVGTLLPDTMPVATELPFKRASTWEPRAVSPGMPPPAAVHSFAPQ